MWGSQHLVHNADTPNANCTVHRIRVQGTTPIAHSLSQDSITLRVTPANLVAHFLTLWFLIRVFNMRLDHQVGFEAVDVQIA